MKFFLLCIIFFLTGTIIVVAQDSKAYEAAMTQMLEVSKSMDAMKQIAPQITAMIKQQSGGSIPEDFLADMEKEMIVMYDKMIKAMIPVYQKYLTLDDIKGVIAFYETPVGKKLAESNTKIAVEIMPIAQQIGMETMQKLMKELQEKKK